MVFQKNWFPAEVNVKLANQLQAALNLNSRFLPVLSLLLITGLFLASGCKSKKVSKESPAFTVIETAKTYRGTPYKYGGTTRSGMDCSALVFHSYFAVGVNLPRKSEDQSKLGQNVELNQVKPGDLLFFATGKKKNQVTHSGIVTEAAKDDIRFIHASTSLGVTEDYLSNRYWSAAFLFAKRIID